MSTPESAAAPFAKKKRLTKPTLKFVVGKPLYVLIAGKIHEGAQRGKPQLDSDGRPKKPPMVCDVVDLLTGEECNMICAEIIKTELSESFPNESYIGHGFAIEKQARKEGKRYDPYDIAEIELTEKFLPLAKQVKDEYAAKVKAEADKKAADEKAEADKKAAEAKAAEDANKPAESAPPAETTPPAAHAGGRRR